jgi:hypothetical protein
MFELSPKRQSPVTCILTLHLFLLLASLGPRRLYVVRSSGCSSTVVLRVKEEPHRLSIIVGSTGVPCLAFPCHLYKKIIKTSSTKISGIMYT